MKRDGTGVVEDRWLSAYAPPAADASSDIDDFSIKREDGRSVLKFKKRVSGDGKNDVDLGKDLHLLFPVSGGPVFGSFVGKHTATPIVSPSKISLLAACGGSEAEAEAESEAEAEAEAEAESEAEAEAEAEAEGNHGSSSKYTPKGAMHAMNCADIVIGMARGTASRVFDAYTRDRSTPMADKVKRLVNFVPSINRKGVGSKRTPRGLHLAARPASVCLSQRTPFQSIDLNHLIRHCVSLTSYST